MDPLMFPTIDLTNLPDGHAVFFGIPDMKTEAICKSSVYERPVRPLRNGVLSNAIDDPNLDISYTIKFRTPDQIRALAESLMALADAITGTKSRK